MSIAYFCDWEPCDCRTTDPTDDGYILLHVDGPTLTFCSLDHCASYILNVIALMENSR